MKRVADMANKTRKISKRVYGIAHEANICTILKIIIIPRPFLLYSTAYEFAFLVQYERESDIKQRNYGFV